MGQDQDPVDTHTGPLVRLLLTRYCDKHNLSLTLDDGIGHAGFIEDGEGNRSFFIGTRFSLNPQGAAEIAKDKAYTLEFLAKKGMPVPASRLLFSQCAASNLKIKRPGFEHIQNAFDTAIDFANEARYPLFIKPNTGQEGRDVLQVHDEDALGQALCDLFNRHDALLLQTALSGRDLRVVVLDGKVLCMIERSPPEITGDGIHSIADLIEKETRTTLSGSGIKDCLDAQGLKFQDKPAKGQSIRLLPNANLSAGGTARLISPPYPGNLVKLARNCGKTLGLRYYAVDLIVDNLETNTPAATILEINAAPGLAELYRQGPDAANTVEIIYEAVFEALRASLGKI